MFREDLSDRTRLQRLQRVPIVSLCEDLAVVMTAPQSPEGGEEALQKYDSCFFGSLNRNGPFRINNMIESLKEDGLEPKTLLLNLEYVQEALNHLLVLKKE